MKYLLIIFFSVFSITVFSQQKTALIVGISTYPKSSGWTKINSDNDIQILSNELKKKKFNLRILKNQNATKANILKELIKLEKTARKNDTIIIHFSCHGQRFLTKENELIETLIPYNASKFYKKNVYQGENHLLDYELGNYINRIRQKIGSSGLLFVTIDACHSGDATRAIGTDDIIRGTSSVFTSNPFYTPPNLRNVKKNAILPKLKNQSAYCAVYACQSYQNNYELKVGETYYGALSYSFYIALKKVQSFNPVLLSKEIMTEMNKRIKKQNPYIESTFTF